MINGYVGSVPIRPDIRERFNKIKARAEAKVKAEDPAPAPKPHKPRTQESED